MSDNFIQGFDADSPVKPFGFKPLPEGFLADGTYRLTKDLDNPAIDLGS